MKSLPRSTSTVKQYSAKCTNLALTSGAKVRKKKHAPPPPPAPVIFLGKYVSLELTLAEYEIAPNTATLAKIGGAK